MKVILNSDVASLGEEGDILEVSNGYARNYLLPQGLVLEYNPRNIAKLEERREAIEQRKTTKRTEAMSVKERLETEDLVITMTTGRNGKLFGSVTSATIADQLAAKGVDVERKKIEVPDKSIKATGNYKVKIRLYGGAEAILTVKVEPDDKTAAPAAEAAPVVAAPDEAAPEEAASEEAISDEAAPEEEAVEDEAAPDDAAPEDEAAPDEAVAEEDTPVAAAEDEVADESDEEVEDEDTDDENT